MDLHGKNDVIALRNSSLIENNLINLLVSVQRRLILVQLTLFFN